MPEPFYRFGVWVVPPVVAMNGTKFTFRGLENIPQRGGAMLAQNHTSYLDWLPALLAVRERGRRMYFMIKAEMADVKAVNYVIKHARLIPVDRSNGHDAFEVAVQRLREGELIGMHPEATISRSFELREFKTGAARMALAGSGADRSADRLGRAPDLAQGPPEEGVPQQNPDHRRRGAPAAAARHTRGTQHEPAAGDERVAVPSAGEYPHPPGEYWVPRRLGGSAPTREDSQKFRLHELQERLNKRGTDGVTRPGQSQSGIH